MQTDELGKFITELMPKLTADESVVALEIHRGIAASGTISVAILGDRTGLDTARIEEILLSWPGVFRHESGDIVGFWGLTALPSTHVLRIAGETRYAWCAWDCLFLSAILRQPMQVSSVCPQTREPIEIFVAPNSVVQVRPDSTVLSIPLPDVKSCQQDLVSIFCHFGYFFKDQEVAREWTATRPGTRVISVDEGLKLGCMKNEWQFGELR